MCSVGIVILKLKMRVEFDLWELIVHKAVKLMVFEALVKSSRA